MNVKEVNIICSGCFTVMSYKVKCKLEYVCALKELWSSSERVYPFPYIHDVTSNYSVNPYYQGEVLVWLPREVCVPFIKAQEHKERWIFYLFSSQLWSSNLQRFLQNRACRCGRHLKNKATLKWRGLVGGWGESCVHVSVMNFCLAEVSESFILVPCSQFCR